MHSSHSFKLDEYFQMSLRYIRKAFFPAKLMYNAMLCYNNICKNRLWKLNVPLIFVVVLEQMGKSY
jgi:hypothetical protein